MGGWLAKLLGGTREMRILMVGLDAAGIRLSLAVYSISVLLSFPT